MRRLRRIAVPVIALVVAVGGIWAVSAGAQTEPTAPLGTFCPPIPANAVAGQDIVCKVIADPFWTPPTTTTTSTTTTVPTTTTTTVPPVTTTTTTVAPTTTTTAPPAGVRKGWELTASNVGLAPFGLSCDTLPLYIGPAKPLAGNTISGYRIEVPLDLSNGNILIEKSCIKPMQVGSHNEYLVTTTTCAASCTATTAGNVVIRDSEITAEHLSAQVVAGADGFIGVGKLYRNYIHGMGSGISFFETGTVHDAVAENNFVDRLRSYGDSHNEAMTVRDFRKNSGNTRTAKIVGNRLRADSGNTTAGLFIQPTWVSIYNVTVQDNLFEGEGYNLYVERGVSNGTYGNISSVNNRFNPYNGWGPSAVTFGPGWTPWTSNYRYCAACANAQGAVVNP